MLKIWNEVGLKGVNVNFLMVIDKRTKMHDVIKINRLKW